MADPRRRPKSSGVGVRERLLSAAIELFSRKGYSAATTREIVAAAGVTKPVLYYYFRNKEGLYLELMGRATVKFEAVVATYLTGSGSVAKRTLGLCDQIFCLFMENMEVVRLMYSIYYGPPQGAPFFDFDAFHLKLCEGIRRLVEEGVQKGEFRKRDVEEMTWTIVGATHMAMEIELSQVEKRLGREGLSRVLALIFEGISTHRARRKGGPSC